MSWSFNRKRLNEHMTPTPTSSSMPLENKQYYSLMDDITHGQWSKNHYDDNSDYLNHSQNDGIFDPFTMQKSTKKMANKLSRRIQ